MAPIILWTELPNITPKLATPTLTESQTVRSLPTKRHIRICSHPTARNKRIIAYTTYVSVIRILCSKKKCGCFLGQTFEANRVFEEEEDWRWRGGVFAAAEYRQWRDCGIRSACPSTGCQAKGRASGGGEAHRFLCCGAEGCCA